MRLLGSGMHIVELHRIAQIAVIDVAWILSILGQECRVTVRPALQKEFLISAVDASARGPDAGTVEISAVPIPFPAQENVVELDLAAERNVHVGPVEARTTML